MNHTEQLCPNQEQASQNRDRIANQDSIHGYLVQEELLRHWAFGEPPPHDLIYGDLPQVHRKHYHPFATWRTSDG